MKTVAALVYLLTIQVDLAHRLWRRRYPGSQGPLQANSSQANPTQRPNVTMPQGPQQWEQRYYRQTRTRGIEVALLAKTRARGVWTVLTPSLDVSTMNITAKTAVSSTPKPGVQYTPMPILTPAQKASAVEASTRRIAEGVENAALGPYVARGSKAAITKNKETLANEVFEACGNE